MQQYQVGQIADGPKGPLVFDGKKWVPLGQAQQQRPPADPTFPFQGQKIEAEVERTKTQTQGDVVDTAFDQATFDARRRKAEAEAEAAEIAAREASQEFQTRALGNEKKTESRGDRIRTQLAQIQRLRALVKKPFAVGSMSQYFAPEQTGDNTERPTVLSSLFGQNRANVQAAVKTLIGDIVSQEMAARTEANAGQGTASTANALAEQLLLASGVAPLDVNQDDDSFLAALDTAESYYLRQAGQLEGLEPDSELLRRKYMTGKGFDQGGLARPGDEKKSIPFPEEGQTRHAQWVRDNWGNITPESYAAYRVAEDEKFGFTPNVEAYLKTGQQFQQGASEGLLPPVNLTIPPIQAEMQGRDQAAAYLNSDAGAFAVGATNLGGAVDELAGGAYSMVSGRPAGYEIERINSGKQYLAEEYPLAYAGGNLAGGVLAGKAAIKNAPRLAEKIAANPLKSGAAIGGATGAAEFNENRTGGAIFGTAGGGGGGLAGKYVLGPGMDAFMRSGIMRNANNSARSGLSAITGRDFSSNTPNPDVSRAERAMLRTGGIPEATARMREAQDMGLPYSLADSSENFRALAGSVARRSPNVREQVAGALDNRAANRNTRFVENIESNFAPRTNISETQDQIRRAAQIDSGEYYKKAFERAGPVDPEIDAMMRTGVGQEALKKAFRLAEAEGVDPLKIGFDLNDQGEVILRNVPSFETYQTVKRGLDSVLEDFRDPVSKQMPTGNPTIEAMEGFRKRFRGRLEVLNDNFRLGNEAYSKRMRQSDALDSGLEAAGPQTRPDDVEVMLSRMSPAEADMMRRGYATGLTERAQKAADGQDPYRTALTDWNDAKIDKIFPGQRPMLERARGFEDDMNRTNIEVRGGSQTQPRARADEQFDNTLGNAGVEVIATGGIPNVSLAQTGARKLAGYLSDSYRIGRGTELAEELGPTLFETDAAKLRAYAELLKQKAEEDALRGQIYGRRGGLLGTGAGIGGGFTASGLLGFRE